MLYDAFEAPRSDEDMPSGVPPFLPSGGVLFAPHTLDQLSSALATKP